VFGWFSSEAPVPPEARAWIERRSRWLVESFGEEELRDLRIVLPTPEFFPDRYDGSPDAVVSLFSRVCESMGADAAGVRIQLTDAGERRARGERLGIATAEPHGFAAGTYEEVPARIRIDRSQLADPIALIATLAHEIAHLRLIGERRSEQDDDEEPLTDLATVFLGTGVFGANAYFRESHWSAVDQQGWVADRLGYLSREQWGYSLALHAWFRGEERPAWERWLRPDIRGPFRRTLRYLRKRGPGLGRLPV